MCLRRKRKSYGDDCGAFGSGNNSHAGADGDAHIDAYAVTVDDSYTDAYAYSGTH